MTSLWTNEIYRLIKNGITQPESPDSLIITPCPKEEHYLLDCNQNSGFHRDSAAIDLRLGCYFVVFDRSIIPCLDPGSGRKTDAASYQSEVYISVGNYLSLQPGEFVLGATLEWLRLPTTLSAYVIGKSSLGRTGLIIETAGMVHPAFTGCLTLEISNLSGVPILVYPGMDICQIVFHSCTSPSDSKLLDSSKSIHKLSRKPKLGGILDNKRVKAIKARCEEINRPT